MTLIDRWATCLMTTATDYRVAYTYCTVGPGRFKVSDTYSNTQPLPLGVSPDHDPGNLTLSNPWPDKEKSAMTRRIIVLGDFLEDQRPIQTGVPFRTSFSDPHSCKCIHWPSCFEPGRYTRSEMGQMSQLPYLIKLRNTWCTKMSEHQIWNSTTRLFYCSNLSLPPGLSTCICWGSESLVILLRCHDPAEVVTSIQYGECL